ncbi:26999_t:CDS:2 [Dentiscutata erythropus]|uniref:26999_t:CDS:1 n=1 Tax=Dentiscutata erythropus TaxID=1348616 RepID=A0A9N9GFC0_9GLOM|nr:26999_t:CDS:2 [Dentiscutata erythropus]
MQATCKYGKTIKLKRAYDETYFKNHTDSSGCKLQNGLYLQVLVHKQNLAGRAIQNIRLHHAYSPYALYDPELCFENIALVKRLVNTIEYAGPIIAMSDNTKIKERLGFSSIFGCIVGSMLLTESTRVFIYEDVHQIVDMIKSRNAIASQVHVYLL